MHAFLCEIKNGVPEAKNSQEVRWVSIDELQDFPFPKANRRLTEKLMNLDEIT
jgi:A/G-specific adenine glycosylase